MKKVLIILLIIFSFFFIIFLIPVVKGMISLFNYQDYLVLDGYYDKEEYWDPNGFQDYTDYCKYYYNENNLFIENSYYKQVSLTDIKTLKSYFNNFYNWMETSNRLNEYDFSTDYISLNDYYYIKTKEGQTVGTATYNKFDNYTIYYYDTESKTLYYMHSNI